MSVTAPIGLPDRPWEAIGLRVLSGLLFAAMAVCVKLLSGVVPLGEIVFFRSFFALLPLVVFLWLRREFPGGLRTRRPLGHLLRSAFGAAAMFTSFASIAHLPVAEATLIAHLSPVLLALAGATFLSERLTRWRVGGLGLGLAGVLVLVGPELSGGTDAERITGYGFGLLTAILTALALTMVRALSATESPGAIAFYFVVAAMLGGLATLPFGWMVPQGGPLALLVLAGLFGGAAHIAMTLSFRMAEASRLAPVEYMALIWPVLADGLIFGLSPSAGFALALPLVLGGVALAAMEGRRRR